MRSSRRAVLFGATLAFVGALPASAQTHQHNPAHHPSLTADLLTDIAGVERKVVGLARAIPADKWEWRAGPDTAVRTIAEVFKHISADNYLLPAAIGFAPDPATGIKGDDYKTAVAFEQRSMSRDQIVAELEKSFAFLKDALQKTQQEKLGDPVKLFGRTFTTQQAWIMTATHLHEHLGQMIAYARSVGVVPPWSQ